MSTPMMQDEDLQHLGEISRITLPGSGRRCDAPRNVGRLFLELVTTSTNGCTIEGHLVRPGAPVRIEVYADRLPRVLERVRTDEHRAAWAQAEAWANRRNREWREQPKIAQTLAALSTSERTEFLMRSGPMDAGGEARPEHFLREFGFRTGLPPLETCDVIHATTGETMAAADWLALPRAEREGWVLDPPRNADNENDRIAKILGDAMANALGKGKAK